MSHPTELLPEPLPAEPLELVNDWLAYSWQQRLQPNPNAMVLATVAANGQPSARVVLCKEVVPKPGYLVFYTNYQSMKGRQLADNPRAAIVLHWDALHRQVRVEGTVIKAPEADSDAYFASRPWQSRLGAWASAQSQPIASRRDLQASLAASAQRFGTPDPQSPQSETGCNAIVPRPPHWGGLQLWADAVELWVEGEARIHDRARWTRSLAAHGAQFEAGRWSVTRLQP